MLSVEMGGFADHQSLHLAIIKVFDFANQRDARPNANPVTVRQIQERLARVSGVEVFQHGSADSANNPVHLLRMTPNHTSPMVGLQPMLANRVLATTNLLLGGAGESAPPLWVCDFPVDVERVQTCLQEGIRARGHVVHLAIPTEPTVVNLERCAAICTEVCQSYLADPNQCFDGVFELSLSARGDENRANERAVLGCIREIESIGLSSTNLIWVRAGTLSDADGLEQCLNRLGCPTVSATRSRVAPGNDHVRIVLVTFQAHEGAERVATAPISLPSLSTIQHQRIVVCHADDVDGTLLDELHMSLLLLMDGDSGSEHHDEGTVAAVIAALRQALDRPHLAVTALHLEDARGRGSSFGLHVTLHVGNVVLLHDIRNAVLAGQLDQALWKQLAGHRVECTCDRANFVGMYEVGMLKLQALTRHQREALNTWQRSDKLKVHFEAVAGSGKTFVGLHEMQRRLRRQMNGAEGQMRPRVLFIAQNRALVMTIVKVTILWCILVCHTKQHPAATVVLCIQI